MKRRSSAFTLIELLVVVAVIAVIAGLVIVALQGVRGSASRAESLSALRQMGQAYAAYSGEHRQQLLPGYVAAEFISQAGVEATMPDGVKLHEACFGNAGPCAASSYVWRLAPYVDNGWTIFYEDATDQGAVAALEGDVFEGYYGADGVPAGSPGPAFDGGVSERPTFGLNSIFLGGDTTHGGTYATARHPWVSGVEPIAATRLSQVLNPSRVIVFAPAAKVSTAGSTSVYEDPEVGFCELRPPYVERDSSMWVDAQWGVGEQGAVNRTSGGAYAAGAGLPIARGNDDQMPLVRLDGSADVAAIAELARDMRYWSPSDVALARTQDPW